MQAVLLAAGQSSRMFPFGGEVHKAAISLAGKSLIRRTIESLKTCGVNNIIVISSPNNGIDNVLGDMIRDETIRVVHHTGARGMGEALLDATSFIKDDFFLLHAHHFECDKFLPTLLSRKKESKAQSALLVCEDSSAGEYGVVSFDKDRIVEVMEKPKEIQGKHRIIGMYLLSRSFLDYLSREEKHHYSFESALNEFVKSTYVVGVQAEDTAITLKYPWHILDVGDYLLSQITESISDTAVVAQSAVVEGKVIILDGAKIDERAIIKGPCFIGKNAYVGTNTILRNGVILEEGVRLGANIEAKHSIFFKDSTTHSGYIGDSVVGENSKIAAYFCTGNVRLDRQNIGVWIKDKKVDTGKKSLGVFMGSSVRSGIRVSTMPGVIIGNDVTIGPSTVVAKNIASSTTYYTELSQIVEEQKQESIISKQKVILFDIDYTLFDTKIFKDSFLKTFSLYDEVIDVLHALRNHAVLGIFSEGNLDLQQSKLLKTAIDRHFAEGHIYIVERKNDSLAGVLKQYKGQQLFLIDDKIEVLHMAKRIAPEAYTIWVKRGPFAKNAVLSSEFSPDATVEDLQMVLPIILGV